MYIGLLWESANVMVKYTSHFVKYHYIISIVLID